jgi:plasmid stabilization system protein ParE
VNESFNVFITQPAESDIDEAFCWWASNRSLEQASRWFDAIHDAIASLRRMPKRCAVVRDFGSRSPDVRELLFGVGRHATHRVFFEVKGSTVTVLRVRHVAQGTLTPRELGHLD